MSEGKKKVALWDAESRRVYKRLLSYSARYWGVILVSVVGFAVDGGALAYFTSKLQPIMDKLLEKKDPYLIHWMPIWIIAIFLVRGIAILISNYGMGYVSRNVVQSMQRDVFAAYLRLPATFFGNEHSGHQISRITYTSEQIAGAATDALKVSVTESITVVGMFIVMLYKSLYLTTALLVLVPAIVLIASAVSRRYRVVSRRIQGMMGSVTGTVEEMLKAHREVRIYGKCPTMRATSTSRSWRLARFPVHPSRPWRRWHWQAWCIWLRVRRRSITSRRACSLPCLRPWAACCPR
jgi:subfamily B ATP-binding cassette protein MsbA